MVSHLLAAAFVLFSVDPQPSSSASLVVASPGIPAYIKGSLPPKKEVTWSITFKSAKEARFLVLSGGRDISYDLYDSQNISTNEGVSDGDWLPVTSGHYKIVVTNTTALGQKANGRTVNFEIKIEAR